MTLFEHALLSNVVWAAALAATAALVSRFFATRSRRATALIHGLWVLFLLRLIIPPVVYVAYSFAPVPLFPITPDVATAVAPTTPRVSTGAVTAPPSTSDGSSVSKRRDVASAARASGPLPARESVIQRQSEVPSLAAPRRASRPAPSPTVSAAPPANLLDAWRLAALMIWSLGATLCAATVALQVIRFRRLLRAAHPADETLREEVAEMAHRLGLQRPPEVLMIPARLPPLVWAFTGPPRLLLPTELWDRLDDPQRQTVLAHELAHLRRRDHWVRWLEAVTLVLHWWNPLAWWARRQIERSEEQCCDAWVVWALPDAVDAYAEALVATTAFLSGPRPRWLVGATGIGRITDLKRRLSMILSESEAAPARLARPASRVVLIAGVIAVLLLPGWSPVPGDVPKPPADPVAAPSPAPPTPPAPPQPPAAELPPLPLAPLPQPETKPAPPPPAPSATPVAKPTEKELPPNGTPSSPLPPPDAPAPPKPAPAEKPSLGPVPEPPGAPAAGPKVVDVCQAVEAEMVEYDTFKGRIEAAEAVEIRAHVGGVLTKVPARDKPIVQKGDLLFEIDSRPFQAELRKAEAEIARCEAQVNLRTGNLERAMRLKKSDAISSDEYARIEGEREDAVAALRVAQPALELARLKLESTQVTAPISGRLSQPRLVPGELVGADTTLLATIDSTDAMIVEFQMPTSTVLKRVRETRTGDAVGAATGLARLIGLPVEVILDDQDPPRRSVIESTDSRIDPAQAGTLRCRAAISNTDGLLLPGLFVRLRMPLPSYRALTVPGTAVNLNHQGRTESGTPTYPVFIVDEANELKLQWLVLGQQQPSGAWPVREGLSASDWVVIKNPREWHGGRRVKMNQLPFPSSPKKTEE